MVLKKTGKFLFIYCPILSLNPACTGTEYLNAWTPAPLLFPIFPNLRKMTLSFLFVATFPLFSLCQISPLPINPENPCFSTPKSVAYAVS